MPAPCYAWPSVTNINSALSPGYLSPFRPMSFEPAALPLAQPFPQQGGMCMLYSNPTAARGVTDIQASTAQDMTGGLVEGSSDLAGGVSDGAGAAARRGAAAAGNTAADTLRGFARGGGRLLGPASIALDLVGGGMKINEAWNDRTLTDRQRDEKVGEAAVGTAGSVAGGAGGAWAGALAGAALGSAVPVVGTVIGGIAGAVLGGFLGGKAGEKAGEAVGRTSAGRAVGDAINDVAGR